MIPALIYRLCVFVTFKVTLSAMVLSCHVNGWSAIFLSKQHNIFKRMPQCDSSTSLTDSVHFSPGVDLLWSSLFFCSNIPRAFSISVVIPLLPIRADPHSSPQISNMVDICNAMEGYWGRSHTNQREKAVWKESTVRLFFISLVLPLSIASF